MHHDLATAFELGWQTAIVLGLGGAVIVALSAAAARGLRSAVWQRTVWQVAIAGLAALAVVELTGVGPAAVRLCRVSWRTASGPARAAMDDGAARNRQTESRLDDARSERRDLADWRCESVPDGVQLASTDCPSAGAPGGYPAANDTRAATPAADLDCGAGVSPASVKAGVSPAARGAGVSPALLDAGGMPAPQGIVAPPEATDPGASSASGSTALAARWLVLIWGVGAAAVFGWMAWSRFLLYRFARRSAAIRDPHVLGRVAAHGRRLGIRRPIRVLSSGRLGAPVAFGFLKPRIALPASFCDEFEPREQDAMLVHELAHLAAGDPAWHALAGLMCGLLWWHPAAWWSRRRLRAASEAAADEASLLVPDGPRVLAASLVALGRRLTRPGQLAWLSADGGGFRSALGRRVERLLDLRARPRVAPGRGRLLAAKIALPGALVCVAISCTAWAQSRAPLLEGGTTMNVLSISWRSSLAATALWALLGPSPVAAPAAEREKEKVAAPDRERGEGDRPAAKPREGERREGEAREGREGRDRPRGEAREGDRPERREVQTDARAREIAEKRQQIMGQIQELKQRFEKLKDGPDADRREVGEKLEKLMHQLREMGPMPEGRRPEGGPDRGPLFQRLEQVKREMNGARERNDKDAMERLQKEGQEIMKMIRQAGGEGRQPEGDARRPDAPRGDGPGEAIRRLQHLRAAADNLRAAGVGDAADRIGEMAERVARELRERGVPVPDGRGPEGRGDREGPQPDRMGPGVQDLRNEVQQMRREMQELREMLKRTMERERGERK